MLEKNNVYLMDCLDGLNLLDDKLVDAFIIDPPYFIESLKNNDTLKERSLRQSLITTK